jgi:hypothetical protein
VIAVVLVTLVSAAPVGACVDRAACRFKVGEDAALKEAVEALDLSVGELKAEPLKRAGGDLAFALTSDRRDGLVVVKAVSLQRPATIWGEASARVLAVSKPEWKQRALVAAIKTAVPRALEDLQVQIAGVRKLLLSVRVSGLDGKTRDHAEKALLPCLKSLYELTGPVSAPELKAGYLDEAIEYLPEKDEPRDSLAWQVGRVREAMLGGLRSRCSVGGGPLQGWATSVTADEINRAVVVSFKR